MQSLPIHQGHSHFAFVERVVGVVDIAVEAVALRELECCGCLDR